MEDKNATAAAHEAVETLLVDGGFTMDFSFDVIDISKEIAAQIEEMMRLSAHGHFGEARVISDGFLADHMDIFPVAAERMRLLYDQGDYDELAQVSRDWLTAVGDTDAHSQEDVDCATKIVRLFWCIATGSVLPVRNLERLLEQHSDTGIEDVLPEQILELVLSVHAKLLEPDALVDPITLLTFMERLLGSAPSWAGASLVELCTPSLTVNSARTLWNRSQSLRLSAQAEATEKAIDDSLYFDFMISYYEAYLHHSLIDRNDSSPQDISRVEKENQNSGHSEMALLGDLTRLLDGKPALDDEASGRWRMAEKQEVQAIERSKKLLGEIHPDTLMSLQKLARIYSKQARWREAEDLQVQVVETTQKTLGAGNLLTLSRKNMLATLLTFASIGSLPEGLIRAEKLQVQMFEERRRLLGEQHPDMLICIGDIASTYMYQGSWEEAIKWQGKLVRGLEMMLGVEHVRTLRSKSDLASIYSNVGRLNDAEDLQMRVVDGRRKALGDDHVDTRRSAIDLASIYTQQGRLIEAKAIRDATMNSLVQEVKEHGSNNQIRNWRRFIRQCLLTVDHLVAKDESPVRIVNWLLVLDGLDEIATAHDDKHMMHAIARRSDALRWTPLSWSWAAAYRSKPSISQGFARFDTVAAAAYRDFGRKHMSGQHASAGPPPGSNEPADRIKEIFDDAKRVPV